ncbi:hypothetical protein ACIQ1J_22445 [Streptomyces sp. NPDC097107]|uniref:hypothetical protein n=1 Tax=Streptomyces sp. NPDC097107 TaxID=3366089 RepID=UPI0037FAE8D6
MVSSAGTWSSHGIGDGGDPGRIRLLRKFLAALTEQLRSGRLPSDPVRLYRVADTATSALTTDKDLGSLRALTAPARSLNGIDHDGIDFRSLPLSPYPEDPGRVVAAQPGGHGVPAGGPPRRAAPARVGSCEKARPSTGSGSVTQVTWRVRTA